MNMIKQITATAAVLGMVAVILGAFGAHGLRAKVSAADLEVWKTAVNYHFYHVLALLFLAAIPGLQPGLVKWSYVFFVLGIALFSGSLYLLSTRAVTNISFSSVLGPITPLGGLCFILGWVLLLLAALKK